MIRRPPRSTQSRSSAASDVYKRQFHFFIADKSGKSLIVEWLDNEMVITEDTAVTNFAVSYTHPEPTRPY